MEIQRDLIINWCSENFSIPVEVIHKNFMDILNRRCDDIYNFIFINNVNAATMLQTAILNNKVDEVLDASISIIASAKEEYGQVWIDAKRIFTENFSKKYYQTQGGRN